MQPVQSTAEHGRAEIVLIGDGNRLQPAVRGLLAGTFRLAEASLPDATPGEALPVFCLTKLGARETARVDPLLDPTAGPPIFIFPTYKQDNVDHARELGAEGWFIAPLDEPAILAAAKRALNRRVQAGWSRLRRPEAVALRASLASFDGLFEAAAQGNRLPVANIYATCETIQAAIDQSDVNRWLGALRQHHNCTYRHSMYVCGTLAFFAHALGIRGDDLRRLTVGGFLHDAGKAQIPLAILDKPGKLDRDEWAVMRRHPEHSREILLRESGLEANIVARAVHHHEKLDGTGYPDGFAGAQINDHVRLTALADVYAALVEERAYKPAMPNRQALDLMATFTGHLDQSLVRAFRSFILDQVEDAA